MRWVTALVLLVACKHDAEQLAPNAKEDVSAWLGVDAPCSACLSSTCELQADVCLNDAPCRLAMTRCTPPNPGCAQRTLEARQFALCAQDACYDACGAVAQKQTCVGTYEWVAPVESGPITFELRARPYQGSWDGVARVVPCSGPTPMCDEDLAVDAKQEATVPARYNYSVARSRPYFRVTGDGLRTVLFYEDGYIYPGTQLNIPTLAEDVFKLLAGLLGAPLDETKGTLDVTVYDCNGDPLDGVKLELAQGGGVPYYFDDAVPKPAASYPQTSSLGQGGFVNLEPGLYDLTATVNGGIFARIESVIVQPGIVTHVNLMPLSRDEAAQAQR